jgi:uncharacterized protein YegP (UPF0339 family)
MNGKHIRSGSTVGDESSQTNWARLRALAEEEIETAIAGDPDSYSIDEAELLGRKGASYRFEIYHNRDGVWQWRLLASGGEVLAVSGRAFPSRQSVEGAIASLRDALLGAQSQAA